MYLVNGPHLGVKHSSVGENTLQIRCVPTVNAFVTNVLLKKFTLLPFPALALNRPSSGSCQTNVIPNDFQSHPIVILRDWFFRIKFSCSRSGHG